MRSLFPPRKAFSLIEVMIASVLTLLMMAALAQGFKRLSDSIAQGRARLVLTDRLRSTLMVIKQDLANCTVKPNPPMKLTEATGYFEFYDGAMSAETMNRLYPTDVADGSADNGFEDVNSNRISDCDDVLMFTAKAKGEPFLGKAPLALVKKALDSAYVPTAQEWSTLVTISSEYAEIAYFMLPTPCPEIQELRRTQHAINHTVECYDPMTGIPIYEASLLPTQMSVGGPFTYTNGTSSIRMPTRYTLYRRVLLVRPDLNGDLNELDTTSSDSTIKPWADPLLAGNFDATVMTYLQLAHQRCDVSIRLGPGSSIIANSLTDLSIPENRFAHCRLPIPAGTTVAEPTTMPLLATSWVLPDVAMSFNLPSNGINDTNGDRVPDTAPVYSLPTGPLPSGRPMATAVYGGFLRPEFALGRLGQGLVDPQLEFDSTVSDMLKIKSRLGEDVLATNVVGFDLKAFDPTAELVFSLGGDNQPGIQNVDDNNNGMMDDFLEMGARGSDDEVLFPGDTGYYGISSSTLTPPAAIAGRGAFVDLAWAWKHRPPVDAENFRSVPSVFSGEQLGVSGDPKLIMNDNLWLSGAVRAARGATASPGSGGLISCVYQPRYDSWTNNYQLDTFAQLAGNWTATASTDPLVMATEGPPPFPAPLRAIQVSLRLDDPTAGMAQQLSLVHEFVTK